MNMSATGEKKDKGKGRKEKEKGGGERERRRGRLSLIIYIDVGVTSFDEGGVHMNMTATYAIPCTYPFPAIII